VNTQIHPCIFTNRTKTSSNSSKCTLCP